MSNNQTLVGDKTIVNSAVKTIENPDVQIIKKSKYLKGNNNFNNEIISFQNFLEKTKKTYNVQQNITTKDKLKLFNKIDEHFEKISIIINNLKNPTSIELHKQEYQNKIQKYFLGFKLGERAYKKPLGYPGDYKMINYYYKGQSESKSFFDHLLDEYTIHHTNCGKGVQNRIPFIKEFINKNKPTKKTMNILNVASGPAEEARQLINDDKIKGINWSFLDIDNNALSFVKKNLDSTNNINFINENILTFLKKDNTNKYDLIYSLGLFDYFKDSSFSWIMNHLFKLLDNNGVLIIGNLSEHKHKIYMEFIAEWDLKYRNTIDLENIAKKNNYSNFEIKTTNDLTQNYLIIRKN